MRIGHAEERRCAEGSACEDAEGAPRAVIAHVDAPQGCAPRPLLRAPLLDAPFPTAAAPGTRKTAHSGCVLDVTCLTARVNLALHGLRVWVEKRGPMANSGARRCHMSHRCCEAGWSPFEWRHRDGRSVMSRRGEEWNRWRYARTWPVQKAAAREHSRRTLKPMPRGPVGLSASLLAEARNHYRPPSGSNSKCFCASSSARTRLRLRALLSTVPIRIGTQKLGARGFASVISYRVAVPDFSVPVTTTGRHQHNIHDASGGSRYREPH